MPINTPWINVSFDSTTYVGTNPNAGNGAGIPDMAIIGRLRLGGASNCSIANNATGCFVFNKTIFQNPISVPGAGELFGVIIPGGATSNPTIGQYLVITLPSTAFVDACVEIVDIVTSEAAWNSGTATCPSDFDSTGYGGTNYTSCPCSVPYTNLVEFSLSVVPVVSVFNNCSDCIGAIPGCIDPNAHNYLTPGIGCLDKLTTSCTAPGIVDGNFPSGCDPMAGDVCCCPTDDDGSCLYLGCSDGGANNYDVNNSDGCDDGSSTPDPSLYSCCRYDGCWDNATSCPNGYDPSVVLGVAPYPNNGCIPNYEYDCLDNPLPLPSNGGQANSICCYIIGCLDSSADNYDGLSNGCYWPAIPGGGSANDCCEYEGCTDITADNYDANANLDDGSCTYTVTGCMDDGCCTDESGPCGAIGSNISSQCPSGLHRCDNNSGVSYCSALSDYDISATNYNSLATEDDGSCAYHYGWYCDLDGTISGTPYSCYDDTPTGGNPTSYPCDDNASCIMAEILCNNACGIVFDECDVFFNDAEGRVYHYDPASPNQLTPLFKDEQFNETLYGYGTSSWDIANSSDKIWLYSCVVYDHATGQREFVGPDPKGIIREYEITFNPSFTIGDSAGTMYPPFKVNPEFNRDIDITNICRDYGYDSAGFNIIGSGLAAKNNTTLVAAGEQVIEIDITNLTATATPLFTLPRLSNPSIDGGTSQQAKCTGDVLIDPISSNIIVTYYDEPSWNGKIGQFQQGGGGAPMGNNWFETTVKSYPGHSLTFGLFLWQTDWFVVDNLISGWQTDIYKVTDIANLPPTLPPPHGTVQIDNSSGSVNYTYGASQKPECIIINDVGGCTDPLAINYNPLATTDDGSCIYPVEKIKGCLPRLTKEEFLMNVCQKPETRSDVFIERGKVSVFEKPQRLAQILTIGELEMHGYGYYNILIEK